MVNLRQSFYLANWNRRRQLVEYCVQVVDERLEQKRNAVSEPDPDQREVRMTQASIYSDGVLVRDLGKVTIDLELTSRSATRCTMSLQSSQL